MRARNWRELDVLIITGDAYVDHPSFGAAVIGRVLERAGYRVGIVARPRFDGLADFLRLGRPTLFAGVTAGSVDSYVNNFTPHLARRRDDLYAPGGKGGGRPDQATLVYANRIREAFPGLPVILGGIEASLRRFAYLDPVRGKIRRSILVDSRADLLVYGSGEQPVVEIAHRLASGERLEGIPGTARFIPGAAKVPAAAVTLPHFSEVREDPGRLLDQTRAQEIAARPGFREQMAQRYPEGLVVSEPPIEDGTTDLDLLAELPFAREAHPSYSSGIPALETVRWSIISHRGCPGGCSFCGLAAHQGRGVWARSMDSIVSEAKRLVKTAGFKGTITDIGGPTANAYGISRTAPEACDRCRRVSCLHPKICPHLDTRPSALLALLDKASSLDGIRHVFLASGIRHDMALPHPELIREVARRYTGGQLKLAPEHVAPEVLRLMRKPPIELFEAFESIFLEAGKAAGKKQYIVPYFMAGFPGCTRAAAAQAARFLAARGQVLQQAQTFTPLAGTAAAAMAAAGKDFRGNPIYMPDLQEKRRQKRQLVTPPPKRGGGTGRKRKRR